MTERRTAIIIGAGPAGLTAAYELLDRTDIRPVIFEATCDIGGISKTVNYRGNRIDIGGHRFFSKVDRVVGWWTNILPLQGAPARDYGELGIEMPLAGETVTRELGGGTPHRQPAPDPERDDRVFLLRHRLSRIYFLRRFFDYPISLSLATLRNLGPLRIARIGLSYLQASVRPIRDERSLEDFFINRFGRELYLTFFKDYTEKVWGVPCREIKPEWGAQRIKGLSVAKTLYHGLQKLIARSGDTPRHQVETSLIDRFMYPKLGPGQLWEEVADRIVRHGGELHLRHEVTGLVREGENVTGVRVLDRQSGDERLVTGDLFFSSMPVRDLVAAMTPSLPAEVRQVAADLRYRDFLTVGLLVQRLAVANETAIRTINNIIPDNWIYVQEREVRLGRIQIFNNWSPYMVKDPDSVWLGLEYFCQEGDDLWSAVDRELIDFAAAELASIGIIDPACVLDGVVIRVPKAYPAYFGSYDRFDRVREEVDRFGNLYLIGRNGMHRYNNTDHSMLTAMVAVDNIVSGCRSKENIWQVNTEEGYHEQK